MKRIIVTQDENKIIFIDKIQHISLYEFYKTNEICTWIIEAKFGETDNCCFSETLAKYETKELAKKLFNDLIDWLSTSKERWTMPKDVSINGYRDTRWTYGCFRMPILISKK